jgi:autotransporter-associated beta strand protein
MTISTWGLNAVAFPDNYDISTNWTAGIPGVGDTGFFGTSNNTTVDISANNNVGSWLFSPGASAYTWQSNYTITVDYGVTLKFVGSGITIYRGSSTINNIGFLEFYNLASAGTATIVNINALSFKDFTTSGNANITNDNQMAYFSNSSAGNSTIKNDYVIIFHESSSAGDANITNNHGISFFDSSTAADASIHTTVGAQLQFDHSSDGGSAQLKTDALGTVDFSNSAGPLNNGNLGVGSIAGAGTYLLGGDHLTVGSGDVSGLIDGFGGSLVKAGNAKLRLSHGGNTYSGGSTIEQGILELDAIGAAGPGAITFANVGKSTATLEIDKAALLAHHFGNAIDNFGKHDFLDLAGLHFHSGATATYHKLNHLLRVHIGSVADTFTLNSPLGTHFEAARDHHGGTEVFLVFA